MFSRFSYDVYLISCSQVDKCLVCLVIECFIELGRAQLSDWLLFSNINI